MKIDMIKKSATPPSSYPQLDQLIEGYLHQDMDLIAETVPEAVSKFADTATEERKAGLLADCERFLVDNAENLETAFAKRYWFDFEPEHIGQSVAEFFAMVRAIVADPSVYKRFETGKDS